MSIRTLRAVGMAVVSLLALGGCNSNFDVDVTLDKTGLTDSAGTLRPMEVHLVGVNQTSYDEWSAKSMTQYWRNPPVDPEVFAMHFGERLPLEQVLSKKDAIWKAWSGKKAKYLFILASLPGAQDDKLGAADSRRVILTLDTSKYSQYNFGSQTIRIRVSANRIECLNPPKE